MKKLLFIFIFITSICYAQDFSEPVNISVAGQDAFNAQLAIDSNNNIVAIWTRFDGTNNIIQSSTSSDQGANWSTPVNLSVAGQNAATPQLAIDSNNNIVAIWQRSNGTNNIIQSSTSTDQGSSWSTPVDLSVAGQNAATPQLAIDSNNNIVAIWFRSNGTNMIIQSSTSTDQGANWSTPVNLSEAGQHAANPQLAIDSNNNIVAIWYRSNGTNNIIQSSTSTDQGANWSTPVNLSVAGQDAATPQLAIDSNNNIVAIWQRSNGTNMIIQSSTSTDQGANWSTPVNLSVAGQNASNPQLAIDSNNNIVAIWQRSDGTNTIIQSSTSTDQGANWSTPVNLSEAGQDAEIPQLAIDSNNNIVAIWDRFDGTNYIIQSSTSTDQGANWSTPDNLSEAGQSAGESQIAIDSNNNIVAIWTRSDGANFIIQSSTNAKLIFLFKNLFLIR
jgi:stringent starvation protein B